LLGLTDKTMVVVGNFSVRLVHADTKEPFKEHMGPDGKIYTEAEPGADYFIETEVVGGDPNKHSCWTYTVDGKGLGYYTWLNMSDGKDYIGIWSCLDGIAKDLALSFQRPSIVGSESSTVNGTLAGSVKVEVSEAIPTGTKPRED
jgi:hypothetical protein